MEDSPLCLPLQGFPSVEVILLGVSRESGNGFFRDHGGDYILAFI